MSLALPVQSPDNGGVHLPWRGAPATEVACLHVRSVERLDGGAVHPLGRLQETACQPGSISSRTFLGGARQHNGDAHGAKHVPPSPGGSLEPMTGEHLPTIWVLTQEQRCHVRPKGRSEQPLSKSVDPQLATLLVSAVGLFQDAVAFG